MSTAGVNIFIIYSKLNANSGHLISAILKVVLNSEII